MHSLQSCHGIIEISLSWSTPLISSDLHTWVTVCREQSMQKAGGKGLGHTLQWVENISSMSIQTCVFGGVLGSFSSNRAGVNQALRQMGQIIYWTRVFFGVTLSSCWQYMKVITVLVYTQLMFSWLSSLPSVL